MIFMLIVPNLLDAEDNPNLDPLAGKKARIQELEKQINSVKEEIRKQKARISFLALKGFPGDDPLFLSISKSDLEKLLNTCFSSIRGKSQIQLDGLGRDYEWTIKDIYFDWNGKTFNVNGNFLINVEHCCTCQGKSYGRLQISIDDIRTENYSFSCDTPIGHLDAQADPEVTRIGMMATFVDTYPLARIEGVQTSKDTIRLRGGMKVLVTENQMMMSVPDIILKK